MSGFPPIRANPAVPPAQIVLKAHDLCRRGQFESGVEFLKRFGGPDLQPVVHILMANRDARDDAKWLQNLNAYLSRYGTLPLQLRGGAKKKFHRLAAKPVSYVDDGPLVTVIMSAFNAERTIETAARSILGQSWRPIELFIVDDVSTDGTFKIARRLAAEDARIKVLRNPVNVGPYVSRNRVLGQCGGAYVTCHDADDWALPDRIEMQVGEMREGGLAGAVMRAVRMTETGLITGLGAPPHRSHDGVLQTSHVSAFFDRDALRDRLGYWDCVRFAADTEMIARASLALGSGFREVARPCLIYLDNPQSLTNHPVTGISRGGLSPARQAYREAWRAWHAAIRPDEAYLPFPAQERVFPAPHEMQVPVDKIATCLS